MQLSLAVILALPALALANPALVVRQSNDTCPVGPIQCCQSTYSYDSETGRAAVQLHKALYGSANVDSAASNGSAGVGCSPIIGSTCSAEPNCCSASGLVAIGCIPISVL